MNINIKTGLIISSIVILLSIIFMKYELLRTEGILGIFLMPAFVINASMLLKIYKDEKKTSE